MIDIEQRTRVLAKSWGVALPEECTFTMAVLAMMEKLFDQQASILRRLQEVHAEQTKMWMQLRAEEKGSEKSSDRSNSGINQPPATSVRAKRTGGAGRKY